MKDLKQSVTRPDYESRFNNSLDFGQYATNLNVMKTASTHG